MVQPLWKTVLSVSYKPKYTLTIQSTNHSPIYLPKGVENLCPHKKPAHRCYSFICNSQNYGSIQKCPSVGGWINSGIPYNGYYSAIERNELSSHEGHGGNVNVLLSERSTIWKGTLCDSNYDIPEGANYEDSKKKISGCQGLKDQGKGMKEAEHRERILGQWNCSVWYYSGGYGAD